MRETQSVETSVGAWRTGAILAGLAILYWTTQAAAESRSPAEAAVLACRTVADPTQQLACFREASDALERATIASEPVKRPFGAPKARPSPISKAKREESLTVKVLSLSDRGDGRVLFKFDDGSTWVQTRTDESIAGSLNVGDEVTLRHGLFSGFVLDIRGRTSVRVARIGGG